MSGVMAYLEAALQGVDRYFDANKLMVPFLALLLLFLLTSIKPWGEKHFVFSAYTMLMSLLLLVPVTAMLIMRYQTAYYDYEWAWSMVPVTAVLAYGAVLLTERAGKKPGLLLSTLAVILVFFICGNQGSLLTVESEEATAQENTAEILQELQDFGTIQERVLWAPRSVMEQVRRQDGKFLLIYGRDMWDVKAGAYDYEAYSESVTNAYIWLETITELAEVASIMADPALSLTIQCEEREITGAEEIHLRTMLQEGVNVLVLPHLVAEHVEESILNIAEEMQLTIQNTYTEEYTIYLVTGV